MSGSGHSKFCRLLVRMEIIMTELEKYYNKFNEEKRLISRHGTVEYVVSMKYIHDYLSEDKSDKILDIGAGTGRYSVALANEGYDVTAVELVKYNLGILKSKCSSVKAYQGTALNLSRFEDESFDVTLLFGPMYHLYTFDDKLKALNEAKRVTKNGGTILTAYCMNDYAVLTYAFKENNLKDCIAKNKIAEDFHCVSEPEDLYDYVRIDDINELDKAAGLERIKIIAPDGPANYMRQVLNAMDEETFETFIKYQLTVAERQDMIGASAHTVDILRKCTGGSNRYDKALKVLNKKIM